VKGQTLRDQYPPLRTSIEPPPAVSGDFSGYMQSVGGNTITCKIADSLPSDDVGSFDIEVGDFVEVVPPLSAVTNQLLCSGVATDTNEITLIVHNSSGGAVNLGSESFKFKSTRY